MNSYTKVIGRSLIAVMLCALALMAASCAKPGVTKPSVTKPSITKTAQNVVDSMAKGDFQAATQDFDGAMKTQMPAQKLEQFWGRLTGQAGALKSCTGTREAEEQGFKSVYVTCRFERTSLDVKIVFDSADQISGLWLVPTQTGPAVPGE